MQRRGFLAGGLSLSVLAGCGDAPEVSRAAAGLPADLRPHANPRYDAWVARFRGRAGARGLSQSVLNAAFRDAGFLPGVVTRDRNQIERRRSLEEYLSIAASEERVAKGRAAFARHRKTLQAIEARFGVDGSVLTAIWGLESFYGTRMGQIPVISATSTLAFDGRRGPFFETQLIHALRIIQGGHIAPSRMTGSWAGAMGHLQFIPTTFTGYAVDFNGDGRRDIWSADPSDALAGTANYLARAGYRRGLRPAGLPGEGLSGRAIRPQRGGPAFVVTANFNVIKRYNNSDKYALGVSHLADRIRGAGPLEAVFPPDAYGLVKTDRIALQKGLARRGYAPGTIDGVVGDKTRRAIAAFQQNAGLPVTGQPSKALLGQLR